MPDDPILDELARRFNNLTPDERLLLNLFAQLTEDQKTVALRQLHDLLDRSVANYRRTVLGTGKEE